MTLFLAAGEYIGTYLTASMYLTLTAAWFGTAGAFARALTVC